MNSIEKWEIYDIRDIPTGKKRRFMCFTHIGLFRKLQKNLQSLTYEYIYSEKELSVSDYQKFVNSRKRYNLRVENVALAEQQLKAAKTQLKKTSTSNRKTKEFIGLKYMTDWKPPRMRKRYQKYNGV